MSDTFNVCKTFTRNNKLEHEKRIVERGDLSQVRFHKKISNGSWSLTSKRRSSTLKMDLNLSRQL